MVTINIFPPSDAVQKQGENGVGISDAVPGPGNFSISAPASSDAGGPGPATDFTDSSQHNDAAPGPVLQPDNAQNQSFSMDSPPAPTMDYINPAASFQPAPEPVSEPEQHQEFSSNAPEPALLPSGADTGNQEKPFSKKK